MSLSFASLSEHCGGSQNHDLRHTDSVIVSPWGTQRTLSWLRKAYCHFHPFSLLGVAWQEAGAARPSGAGPVAGEEATPGAEDLIQDEAMNIEVNQRCDSALTHSDEPQII